MVAASEVRNEKTSHYISQTDSESKGMKSLLIGLIKAYRYLLSPWLGRQCRFTPSCSIYGLQAIEHHGALRGSLLTAYRILRCNPFCEGGFDPVPGLENPQGNEADKSSPSRQNDASGSDEGLDR